MNFSQLIKTLVDYLDLGKRIATTIPGMVLASVLVLFFFNPADFLGYRDLARNAARLQAEQYKGELKTVEQGQQKSSTEQDLQNRQKMLADLRKQLNSNQDVWTQLTSSYTGILQQIFYMILFLGLLGFAIGTVLDPLSKALFMQMIPEFGERNTAVQGITGHSILKRSQEAFVQRHANKPIAQMVAKLRASRMTAQFFIGRGLISAAEYNDLVDKYYLYSQISIGMIIPMLTVAAALCYRVVSENSLIGGSEFLTILAFVLGAGIGAIFLQRVGLRGYGDFHSQVFDLIAGREQAREDQMQQVGKDQVVNLARAVHRSEEISHKLGETLERSNEYLKGRIDSVQLLVMRVEEALKRLEER